ncbi:MAG TPA: efflux RND transporter periplasmic adaptor subunit [Bacteroidota bacterium]|mgnify:FL=1|jgi:HlyD family secretion protein|nr:efflux RND transporter periplasmic adaptor subunit [Bacteroidota bacterium]
MKKLVLIIPLSVAIIAIAILLFRAFHPSKEYITGVVETTEIDVASKIPGRIDSVFVSEGDKVEKGQILATLESKEINAKVEQARGAMMAAQARMIMAKNGARPEEKEAVEKQYLAAKHQFELADKTFGRIQQVFKDSVISVQEKDQVEFQFKAAKEQLEAAYAKYKMVIKGARYEDIDAAEGIFHQAMNALNEALAYQAETKLISPINGEVFKRVSDPGEIIGSGYPIFTLIDPNDVWVVIQLREDKMTKFKKDMIINGIIPALGNSEYKFKITYIAAMADFATWKATNQKGDFDLKTFELHLRPIKPIDGLRAGMTVRFELPE